MASDGCLKPLLRRLSEDFALTPVVATEIEFYLHGVAAIHAEEEVIRIIAAASAKGGISVACVEKERGPDQYEVSLVPTKDVALIAADTECFKNLMKEVFASSGVQADFSAKPKKDAPGSGLHIHVHLEDAGGGNVFFRDDDTFSSMLLYSIGGLLEFINPCMPIFAPTAASYDRFNFTVNSYLLCPTAANVPLTVSWGGNNRTTAIRLPNKPMDHKHIEHRVAGSDAEVGEVIEAILAGIHYGLSEECDPGEAIYGDATLLQYGLKKIAVSLDEAIQERNDCAALKAYFSF